VLRYMFDAAKGEDEKAGNGECQLILKTEWSDLPTCRNDHEFKFVTRACGYSKDDFISLLYW
jgi:rubredoxin